MKGGSDSLQFFHTNLVNRERDRGRGGGGGGRDGGREDDGVVEDFGECDTKHEDVGLVGVDV